MPVRSSGRGHHPERVAVELLGPARGRVDHRPPQPSVSRERRAGRPRSAPADAPSRASSRCATRCSCRNRSGGDVGLRAPAASTGTPRSSGTGRRGRARVSRGGRRPASASSPSPDRLQQGRGARRGTVPHPRRRARAAGRARPGPAARTRRARRGTTAVQRQTARISWVVADRQSAAPAASRPARTARPAPRPPRAAPGRRRVQARQLPPEEPPQRLEVGRVAPAGARPDPGQRRAHPRLGGCVEGEQRSLQSAAPSSFSAEGALGWGQTLVGGHLMTKFSLDPQHPSAGAHRPVGSAASPPIQRDGTACDLYAPGHQIHYKHQGDARALPAGGGRDALVDGTGSPWSSRTARSWTGATTTPSGCARILELLRGERVIYPDFHALRVGPYWFNCATEADRWQDCRYPEPPRVTTRPDVRCGSSRASGRTARTGSTTPCARRGRARRLGGCTRGTADAPPGRRLPHRPGAGLAAAPRRRLRGHVLRARWHRRTATCTSTSPPSRCGRAATVTAVDLDLDVVRGWTGRVWVDDEDEFAAHRYSPIPRTWSGSRPRPAPRSAPRWRPAAPPYDGRPPRTLDLARRRWTRRPEVTE